MRGSDFNLRITQFHIDTVVSSDSVNVYDTTPKKTYRNLHRYTPEWGRMGLNREKPPVQTPVLVSLYFRAIQRMTLQFKGSAKTLK